jgi:hypothetical protein
LSEVKIRNIPEDPVLSRDYSKVKISRRQSDLGIKPVKVMAKNRFKIFARDGLLNNRSEVVLPNI